ncbi:MAG: metallophosphoesterase family protein [Deltaproteobacteria bacterium]
MKIGVLSDTHLRSPHPVLDFILEELFAGTDMILHAGDIVTRSVLERLEERGVIAVSGNMDDYEVAGLLPNMRVIPADGKRIGLIHGWGSKDGLKKRIVERFPAPKPDVIVFGHSHVPFWGRVDGISMFNPGAAHIRGARGTGTVGILEIAGDEMEGKVISLDQG